MPSEPFPVNAIFAVLHDWNTGAMSDNVAASKILSILGGETLPEALGEIERLRTLLRSFAEPRALLTLDGTVPLRPSTSSSRSRRTTMSKAPADC